MHFELSTRRVLHEVVMQHCDDAAFLCSSRSRLVCAPHLNLAKLGRFDERLAGHLDGIAVAREHGRPTCSVTMEHPDVGCAFVDAVVSLCSNDIQRLDQLLSLASVDCTVEAGVEAALNWLVPTSSANVIARLIASCDPFHRKIGIAVTGVHRLDSASACKRLVHDSEPIVRAAALRTIGELGKIEAIPGLVSSMKNGDPGCQFWAAWSSVLLGDRKDALKALYLHARECTFQRNRALATVLQVTEVAEAHAILSELAHGGESARVLIQGSGLIGDVAYVPWLISQMADGELARVAGESFSMITGADLAWLDLESRPPEDFPAGPTENPDDTNVSMDEDEGLPWPNQAKVQAWWSANGLCFTTGVRHLVGKPPSRGHCIDILKNGYQRQRIAAAHQLCLLNPGTPLFEWRAPAWRQQRELTQVR